MADDEECEQALERQCRDHAEIDRRNGIRMIVQESTPALRRRSSTFDRVLGDGRLRDFEAKFE
jgi:hypothetical protein